jgi:quercetin dioxygenase-like cupin family protein
MLRRIALALAAVTLLSFQASALDDSKYQNLLTPVLKSDRDILGQPVAYPAGPPMITSAIVTIPPGGETGWHLHEVPLFVYVLEGTVTVDYGDKGVRIYKPGTGFIEAMNWAHNGKNEGTVPVRIMAVYMGGGDKTNTEATADPNPPPAPKPEIQ